MMQCSVKRPLLVSLSMVAVVVAVTPASATDWWAMRYSDYICERPSDHDFSSPAAFYEFAKRLGGNPTIDGSGDEVDVSYTDPIHRSRTMPFFRTLAACKNFADGASAIARAMAQDEAAKLDRYR
jgi:hypothetical protein